MSQVRGSSEVVDGARVSPGARSGCRRAKRMPSPYWACLGQNAAMLAPMKNPAW
jgi:hypothetical protein